MKGLLQKGAIEESYSHRQALETYGQLEEHLDCIIHNTELAKQVNIAVFKELARPRMR